MYRMKQNSSHFINAEQMHNLQQIVIDFLLRCEVLSYPRSLLILFAYPLKWKRQQSIYITIFHPSPIVVQIVWKHFLGIKAIEYGKICRLFRPLDMWFHEAKFSISNLRCFCMLYVNKENFHFQRLEGMKMIIFN